MSAKTEKGKPREDIMKDRSLSNSKNVVKISASNVCQPYVQDNGTEQKV